MKCLIGFPVTLKCLTFNDHEVPFYAKICFIVGLTTFFALAFEDNYAKTNEGTPILAATEMFARDSNLWRCKVYLCVMVCARSMHQLTVDAILVD